LFGCCGRTLEQANKLDGMLSSKGTSIDAVLDFDVPDQLLVSASRVSSDAELSGCSCRPVISTSPGRWSWEASGLPAAPGAALALVFPIAKADCPDGPAHTRLAGLHNSATCQQSQLLPLTPGWH